MKKKHQNTINTVLSAVLSVFILAGCSDWLRIDPIDKISESQVFKSEENIHQALNGIYMRMGSNSLYGRNLSLTTVELLAQRYALGGNADNNPYKYYMTHFDYSASSVTSNFLDIWTTGYSTILNINNFIENLNNTGNVILPNYKDILLGEAYGLRAYLHLDLLRLFGPVYLTDSTGISIPYRSEPIIEYSERISASEVMDKIMTDLDKSLVLLKNDPVITEGVMAVPYDSLSASQTKIDEFYRYRNRRMNYYAVSVLKVRALMYRNCKEEAAELAKSLLESSEIHDKFPWAVNEDVVRFEQQDRIFSKEVMFGINSPEMYTNWTNLFSPGITTISTLYAARTSYMENLYEVPAGQFSYCTDWRGVNWMGYSSDADFMVTYKLSKSNRETNFWYFQPLIRKSELYYTLAECENDVNRLDEVRSHRNVKKIVELRPSYDLEEEIQNEFLREMHNEGQIFYFYKRKYQRNIPDASSATSKVSMSKNDYIIPIPQRELDK